MRLTDVAEVVAMGTKVAVVAITEVVDVVEAVAEEAEAVMWMA